MEDPEKVVERVGRRISELREKSGATQAEIAEKLGSTVSNYQRIEHGLQNLSIKTMVKLANAIGVPVAKFFEPTSARRGRPGRPKIRTT